jgi:hypothetical protein
MVSRSHLVQSEHFSRGIVEFIMVDLDVCKRCIKLDVDVALPRRELEGRHGEGRGGVSRWFYVSQEVDGESNFFHERKGHRDYR